MSSSAPTSRLFFVYAPDKTDEGALDRRLSVREAHLKVAKERVANGFIRVGGMMTTPETMLAEKKKMVGSMFVCQAESIEEVKKAVETDIYYTSNVWDAEKIVILPFFAATPIP
ncbi:hypothetical protein BDQ12DRAFT_717646 [Crucibulum laeve]|uniref:YCII-related domain-containing protein n=1 Tax=Crucibulum laeve TaxID=68775 RepID=A0A5C3MGW5_9AGAR|nr:hypothetical protein BDQ12DRAFT_717646 [Crucibulum laeve]